MGDHRRGLLPACLNCRFCESDRFVASVFLWSEARIYLPGSRSQPIARPTSGTCFRGLLRRSSRCGTKSVEFTVGSAAEPIINHRADIAACPRGFAHSHFFLRV